MEYASIQREIHIDASPEVVFEVISSPAHMREWWGGVDADLSPTPGAGGELAWGRGQADTHIEAITVIDAEPPRTFSFRWVYEGADVVTPTNSLLVSFELTPSGAGTVLRMTETGFREKGWEIAVLEAAYQEHVEGWDRFVPRIGEYAARLASER
jgi:uncharacterized protein YndB with AHSA1/START domain